LPPPLSFAGFSLEDCDFARGALPPVEAVPLPLPVGFAVVVDVVFVELAGLVVFERFVPATRVPLFVFGGCDGFVGWVFLMFAFTFGDPCSALDAPFLT